MSKPANRAMLKLIVEYLLLVLPILIYVVLEAVKAEEPIHVFTSPEWSIGTIFLTLQTQRMFTQEMGSSGMAKGLQQLLSVVVVLVTIAAAVNVYAALPGHGDANMLAVKWVLFALATVLFIYVAGAALYFAETNPHGHHDRGQHDHGHGNHG
jgi:hypothetical protein